MPALWISVGVTLLALFVFGSIKGHYTGVRPLRGGVQTVLVGGLAAAAAFFIARGSPEMAPAIRRVGCTGRPETRRGPDFASIMGDMHRGHDPSFGLFWL